MLCYIWNTSPVYSKIYFTNADNPGGYVIGQLYRYTNTPSTFMLTSLAKVETRPGIGDYIWWYEVLQDGIIKGIRKRDLDLAVELGKIELVK